MNETNRLFYNFAILAGCAILVAGYDWSLWTFFGGLLFMVSIKDKND